MMQLFFIVFFLLCWVFDFLLIFSYIVLYLISSLRYRKELKNKFEEVLVKAYIDSSVGRCEKNERKVSIILDLLKDRPEKSARLFCFLLRNQKKYVTVYIIIWFICFFTIFGFGIIYKFVR